MDRACVAMRPPPRNATITLAVVDAPAYSGIGRYQGLASTYLAELQPGDRVAAAVRPSNARFKPPPDAKTPIVMICAGSGLAPFRGFLQERALQKRAGLSVGPALLFFGMDHPKVDFLYRQELQEWERQGVVQVMGAYSVAPEGDMPFVQDRVWAERDVIERYLSNGAALFVCGDGKNMAPAVRSTLVRIHQEMAKVDAPTAEAWVSDLEFVHGRYVADVFA